VTIWGGEREKGRKREREGEREKERTRRGTSFQQGGRISQKRGS